MPIPKRSFDEIFDFTRASTATYFDSDGVLQTADVDEPRFTHDPETGEALGLLIEESRTNLLLWSEDFTQGAWTFNGDLSVSTGTETAPDGTSTAPLITVSNDGTGVLYQSVSLSGVHPVASCFVKGAAGETIKIEARASNGSVVAQQTITFSGEWERVDNSGVTSDDWTQQTDSSTRWSIRVDGPNTAREFYIWGAQLEEGSMPSSYIPTTDAAVTRAADNVSRELGSEFNQGSFTAIFTFRPGKTSGGGDRYLNFSSVDGTNRFEIGYSSDSRLNMIIGVDGTYTTQTLAVPSYISVDSRDTLTVGIVKDGGTYKAQINGGDTRTLDLADWQGVSRLRVGKGETSAHAGGEFENITYLPYAVTEAELQELTS